MPIFDRPVSGREALSQLVFAGFATLYRSYTRTLDVAVKNAVGAKFDGKRLAAERARVSETIRDKTTKIAIA